MLLAVPTTPFSDDEVWKKSQRSEEKVIHRTPVTEQVFDVRSDRRINGTSMRSEPTH
jgi:hypothetical protein